MEKEKKRHRRVGIRCSLFAYLAICMVFILLAMWFVQIRLLGFFYEREKRVELEMITAQITNDIETEDLAERVADLAFSRQVCVRVFTIADAVGEQVAGQHAIGRCRIHSLKNEMLSTIYERAVANDGVYYKKMTFHSKADLPEGETHLPGVRDNLAATNAVYVRIVPSGETVYMILLDCELTPMNAIMKTLEVQFTWVAALLLLAAFLLAAVMSHMIARPLTVITAKAGELANGKYDADFPLIGYREVQELSETLNFAAREMSVSNTLQKELIANISHDLRTPLTMIKGYGEMMRDIPGENSPENLQVIIDETTRLSELVSDLMDLSKLQAGTKKPELQTFNLTKTVSEAMARYDSLVRRDGYQILFDAEDEFYVKADRTMILQAVYNLINNAIHYTGESLRVSIRLTRCEGGVRCSVSDDGEGIPPDKIDQIWDRYYRIDRVHKRPVTGTGLGLSIVKSVLEAHDLHYGVESALGVGSVFWFEMPLEQPDAQNENGD